MSGLRLESAHLRLHPAHTRLHSTSASTSPSSHPCATCRPQFYYFSGSCYSCPLDFVRCISRCTTLPKHGTRSAILIQLLIAS
jgi:hypothetical protein